MAILVVNEKDLAALEILEASWHSAPLAGRRGATLGLDAHPGACRGAERSLESA
ncbi:MAG TPA: hypothetical protein VF793_07335 [Telluria sp.]